MTYKPHRPGLGQKDLIEMSYEGIGSVGRILEYKARFTPKRVRIFELIGHKKDLVFDGLPENLTNSQFAVPKSANKKRTKYWVHLYKNSEGEARIK